MTGFAAAGFLMVMLTREVPMTNETDDTWGLERTDGEAGTHSPVKTAIQSAAAVPSEAITRDKTAEAQS